MVDDNTIMVHIRRLRMKIEDSPQPSPQYLKTVRGIGYQLSVPGSGKSWEMSAEL